MLYKRTDFDELDDLKNLPENISIVSFNGLNNNKGKLKIYPSVIELGSEMFTRILVNEMKNKFETNK